MPTSKSLKSCAGVIFTAPSPSRGRNIVGDDGDAAADQRQGHSLADQRLVALVIGMDGDGGVAEHGLRARGSDNIRRSILGIEGAMLERIAQMPKVPLYLDLLDLEVGDGVSSFGSQLTRRLSL